jgi:4-amino-4-deoxy-L-arabinose transferase-like glycosyltransferase
LSAFICGSRLFRARVSHPVDPVHPCSHRSFVRPPRWLLIAAGGLVAVLYLACVNNRWAPLPDAALYLGLGRSLAEGVGYRFNGEVSTWVTPGLPLLIAAGNLLFGVQYWFPALLMALSALAAFALMYATLARLVEPWSAFAVTLATALSFLFLRYTQVVLTDVPFGALFWGTLYAVARYLVTSGASNRGDAEHAERAPAGRTGWLVLAAVLSAVGIFVRAPGALLLGPAALGLAFDRSLSGVRRRRLMAAGAVLAAALLTLGAFYLVARHLDDETPPYFRGVTYNVRAGNLYFLDHPLHVPRRALEILGLMLTGDTNREVVGLVAFPFWLIGLLWGLSPSPTPSSEKGTVPLGGESRPAHPTECAGGRKMGTDPNEKPSRGQSPFFGRRRSPRWLLLLPMLLYPAMFFAMWRYADLPERYFLVIQPLWLLPAAEGLWIATAAALRRLHQPAGSALRLGLLGAFTAAVVGANLSDVSALVRDRAYYGHLAEYKRRTHDLRHREFVEIAALLRPGPPLSTPFLARLADGRILHWFSRRTVVELRRFVNPTAADADFACDRFLRRTDCGFLVLPKAPPVFGDRVRARLDGVAGLRLIHDGRFYLVYERGPRYTSRRAP